MTERFHLHNGLTIQSVLYVNLVSPRQAILPRSSCWLCPKQYLVFFRQIWTQSRRYGQGRIQGSRHKPCRLLDGGS